jgi:hypothetical protein
VRISYARLAETARLSNGNVTQVGVSAHSGEPKNEERQARAVHVEAAVFAKPADAACRFLRLKYRLPRHQGVPKSPTERVTVRLQVAQLQYITLKASRTREIRRAGIAAAAHGAKRGNGCRSKQPPETR